MLAVAVDGQMGGIVSTVGAVLQAVIAPLKFIVDGVCAFAGWCSQLNLRVQQQRTDGDIAHAERHNPAFQALTDVEKKAATGHRHGDNIQAEALKGLTPEQQDRVKTLQW